MNGRRPSMALAVALASCCAALGVDGPAATPGPRERSKPTAADRERMTAAAAKRQRRHERNARSRNAAK